MLFNKEYGEIRGNTCNGAMHVTVIRLTDQGQNTKKYLMALKYYESGMGNYAHTKGRNRTNFEAEGRTSADGQFSTQIQVKSRKKRSSRPRMFFFTDI